MKTTERREANHTLHIVLTMLTCGMWAPVWIVAAIRGRRTVRHYPGQYYPTVYPAQAEQYQRVAQQSVTWPPVPSAYDRSGMPSQSLPASPYVPPVNPYSGLTLTDNEPGGQQL